MNELPRSELRGINPDFAFKKSKNLIRSNQSSRSPEEPGELAFRLGCEMIDFNGPI